MVYILFLFSILIASFFYLRLASRFNSWDVELSESLKREMNSLILEFNSTAEKNISLIEGKKKEVTEIVQDISYHIEELKGYKETLIQDISDIQIKLKILSEEEEKKKQETLSKQKNKNYIQLKYQNLEKAPQNSEDDSPTIQTLSKISHNDSLQISETSKHLLEKKQVSDIQPNQVSPPNIVDDFFSPLPEITEVTKNTSNKEDYLSTSYLDIKKEVQLLAKEGLPNDIIAKKLNITKGEVELILVIQGI